MGCRGAAPTYVHFGLSLAVSDITRPPGTRPCASLKAGTLPPAGPSVGGRGPGGRGARLPTSVGMWLMLLWMVVTPEPASWCTLVLRVATPNSWPLITPIMLPRLPRGSPVWKEKDGSDAVTGALSTPHAPSASRSRGRSHCVRE